MSFFLHLKQKSLLRNFILSLTIPVLMTLALSITVILVTALRVKEARHLPEMMHLVQSLSQVVHEQQKERGATSIFLSSRGAQFGPELEKQRQLTDIATEDLTQKLATIKLPKGDDRVSNYLEEIQTGITRRPEIRRQVDRQTLKVGDALDYYTHLNAAMLHEIAAVGALSHDADIIQMVTGFDALLEAKERAGLERAIGSGGFAIGHFDTERLLTLQRLNSQQEMGINFFETIALPEQAELVSQINESEAARDVNRMRAIAFAYPETGNLQGITSEDFFAATTARIGALKAAENDIVAHILSTTDKTLRQGITMMSAFSLAILVCLSAAYVFARNSIREMRTSVRAISNAADRMTDGDINAELPKDSPAELGRIVWSINHFRKSILASQERDAKAAEAEKQREEKERLQEKALQERQATLAREEAEKSRAEQEQQQAYAAEVAEVVAACARGDFSQRIDVAGKDGIIGDISAGLNRISDGVATSLEEIRRALSHLAQGDMTYRSEGDFEGVFADMIHAVEEATSNIAQTLGRVTSASETVRASSTEISTATDDLARRTERSAAMLEETAAALEEMSSSVRCAASSAQGARSAVGEMSTRADDGSRIAQATVEAIDEIQETSDGIARILNVIDDIAFQTNLLALNAGVEAARAGEAGRGFAVVASEVRALAQRSSDSAKEIATMIDRSSSSVKRGVTMVNQTGDALKAIVSDVQEVTAQIQVITNTFDETEQGIAEVTSATSELDRTTQQNAAMFEETNAAVQSLEAEAASLASEVASFRLEMPDESEDWTMKNSAVA